MHTVVCEPRSARSAPLPPREGERLAALEELEILDTLPEAGYDDLTLLASHICGTPIALVSLVDADRQWFKSRVGLGAAQTPRDIAFCAHAILQNGLFEIPDAARDDRFAGNPLVTGAPDVRFYAGAPLETPEGYNLGTLCVIDRVPRQLTDGQRGALLALSRQVMALMVLRRRVAEVELARIEIERGNAAVRASENRFQAFMNNSPAVAFMKDEEGRFAFVNEPMARRFDRRREDWIGRTGFEIWPPAVAEVLHENDRAVLQNGRTISLVEAVPTPDEPECRWQVYKFPFTDGSGGRFLAGMAIDVTREQKVARAMRESEDLYRSVVDRLAEGVFLIDRADKSFVQANDAVVRLLGYTEAELLSKTLYDVALHSRESIDENYAVLDSTGRLADPNREYLCADGTIVGVEISASPVRSGGRDLYSVVIRDVTERRRHEARVIEYQKQLEQLNVKLQALATTDGLTGLHNRAAFEARLAEEFDRAVRHRSGLSALMIDVDHFKAFNDGFGHPAGDEVLRGVGRLLAGSVRGSDFVARYGGEEFVVLLPNTDGAGALRSAERCRAAIAGGDWPLRAITASIGASTIASDIGSGKELIGRADEALYVSKKSGRNRVTLGGDLEAVACEIPAAP